MLTVGKASNIRPRVEHYYFVAEEFAPMLEAMLGKNDE
jgi:hypothetical protein